MVEAAKPGVRLRDRTAEVRFATILGRNGRSADVRKRLQDVFGLAPPGANRTATEGTTRLISTGPDAWLASRAGAPESFGRDLAAAMSPAASVADQGGAFVLLSVSGPNVVDVMIKGAFLDFERFEPGHAAVTVLAHLPVTLWRADEEAFELAAPRSYGRDLRRWVETAAAEFGLALDQSPPG